MAEVVKVYRQEAGQLRFIGKKYGDEDRVNGGFGTQWGMFFRNGWFAQLEKLIPEGEMPCEDGDAYIGLMRWKEGEPFAYWIGMFLPPQAPVPQGYEAVDLEPASWGVAWLKGPESELYGQEMQCAQRLEEEGMQIIACKDGAFWFFERYACPRFTAPDENGHVILDIVHIVK